MYANNSPASGPTPPAPALHPIMDQQHGLPVAAFNYPAEWQAQSQVQWDLRQYGNPVKIFARTFQPNGPAMVEFLPTEPFCWVDPNMGFSQPGQDAGGGITLLQPMPAADVMARWVIPKYRGNSGRILGARPLPQLRQMLQGGQNTPPPQNVSDEGVCVTVEYNANGQAIEEEFYGLKVMHPGIPSYGAAGTLMQYNWGFERIIVFRAAKGQMESIRGVLWNIARSVRVNPAWEQVLTQVQQQLAAQFNQHLQAGYENIAAATRLSKQISANNDAWLNQQQQQRDAAYQSEQNRRHQEQAGGTYTSNDAFGDYIMGRETYNDPGQTNGTSQHSGYHSYVWTNGQEYQYSNDANFDPNVGSSSNWSLMRKKEIGE